MRVDTSEKRTSAGIIPSLVLILAVVSPLWAYVNGGDYHSTRWVFEDNLRRNDWAVGSTEPLPGNYESTKMVSKGVKCTPSDNRDFQYYVSQMVGRALKRLPEEGTNEIPLAAKREIARITCETLYKRVVKYGPFIKEGQTGSLKYKVGVYSFETWWETNYKEGPERGHKIHGRSTSWVPFVALKIVKEGGEENR